MADRETREFLESLYKHAKQDGEDPEDVAERIWQNNRGIDRRTLMQAGALGAGGLMGGAGAMTATQNAAADNHNDSDGNVGDPNDRVDVFGETVDSNSISTEDASFTGPDASVFNLFKHLVAHDPSVPETRYYSIEGLSNADKGAKLQTAMDSLSNYSWVYIPPEVYEGPITHQTTGQVLFSFGNQGVTFTNDSGHAFVVDFDSGNPYQGGVRNISFSTSNAGNDNIHFIPPSTGDSNNFDLVNVHLQASGRHGLYADDASLGNLRMVGGQNSTVPGDFGGDLLHINCQESYFEIDLYAHSIHVGSSTDEVGVYSRSTDADNASITDNTDQTRDVKIRHANLNDWERLNFNVGETVLLERYQNADGAFAQAGQITQGVSTTATAILSRPGGIIHGNSVVVYGTDGSNEFTEHLLYQSYGSATSLGRADRGTVPTTSYAADGSELDLTMGSGTWDITALSTAVRAF